jgi:CcmD family protein
MQNLWYLVAAYGMIWALLFVYVFSIARRQRRLRDELMALESGTVAADPPYSDHR